MVGENSCDGSLFHGRCIPGAGVGVGASVGAGAGVGISVPAALCEVASKANLCPSTASCDATMFPI
jgi:hypothetical protein